MIDGKIARVKKLIEEREAIDAELGAIFGLGQSTKRGRPRKEDTAAGSEAASLPPADADSAQ